MTPFLDGLNLVLYVSEAKAQSNHQTNTSGQKLALQVPYARNKNL
jgi:hypothetical protein